MKTTKTKKKNYIILGVIYFLTVLLVLYLASWYNTYQAYKNEIPVLRDVISEIKKEEVEHYIMENPTTILYICKASNSECREFEKEFKTSIKQKNYQDVVTYLNLEDELNDYNYITNLIDKYSDGDFKLERIPCLINIIDGKVTAIEDGFNGALLTKDEAEKFIDVNKIEQ